MVFARYTKKYLYVILPVLLSVFLTMDKLSAAEQLGKTILARGSVTADRNNAQEALRRLSPVFRQDILRSGANARAQFRMIDDALINLQQNSVLRLLEYELESADGDGNVLMELVTGGLRTITGAVGKKNKQDYQLRTPLATIGIRGTMYEVETVNDGMYVAAWYDGSIWIRSYSGKCDVELGDGSQNRFVFVDKQGVCKILANVPEVFQEGHSSDAPTATVEVEFEIQPLLENPRRELPFQGFALGLGSVVAVLGSADSLGRANPFIDTGDNGVVSAGSGNTDGFQQNIGGYPVSWGRWNQYGVGTEVDSEFTPANDSDGLLWMTYQASDADVVSSRTGSVRYDNMVDSFAQSSMGAVSNVAVQMDVDFGSGAVTNGALSARVPDHTWIGVFDGQVSNGDLALEFNGGALVNAQSGAFTDTDGFIDGDFVGGNAQAIAGGFSMTDQANPDNQIEGLFMVEE